jgi:hypothetical protein
VVTQSQAGQTVRCACGAQLEVPTLRGLRDLAPATAGGGGRVRVWGNRHRIALGLVLFAVACLAAAGYLAARLPPPVEVYTQQEIADNFEAGTPAQVMGAYLELKPELDAATWRTELQRARKIVLLEIAVLLGTSCLGLLGAIVALRSGRPRSR